MAGLKTDNIEWLYSCGFKTLLIRNDGNETIPPLSYASNHYLSQYNCPVIFNG